LEFEVPKVDVCSFTPWRDGYLTVRSKVHNSTRNHTLLQPDWEMFDYE